MTAELISSPPVLAAGNWVWLLAPARQERAVVIAPSGDAMPGVLKPHFRELESLRPEDSIPDVPDSADLVAIARLDACASGPGWFERRVAEGRGVLRDGGSMLVTFSNARWGGRAFGRAEPGRRIRASEVAGVLSAAGFGHVASYYVQPFPGAASSIIPAWAPAAVQHERVQHVSSRLGRLRPFVARVGGHALLYPGCACVGYV